MNPSTIVWLVLLLGFLIVEGVCAIHLVSVWFAAGALVAMITSMLGGAVWLQITLFLAVSAALLILLWPFIRKFLNPKLEKTNIDSVIGTQGLVTQAIDNVAAQGQVKLGPMYWTARSTSGGPICEGALIRVDRIEGVKVYVSTVETAVEV